MYRKNNFSQNTVKTLRQNLTQILPESFYQTHEKTSFYLLTKKTKKQFKTHRRYVFFQFFTEAPRSEKTSFYQHNVQPNMERDTSTGHKRIFFFFPRCVPLLPDLAQILEFRILELEHDFDFERMARCMPCVLWTGGLRSLAPPTKERLKRVCFVSLCK